MPSLVGSEMCIRDRYQRRVHGENCLFQQLHRKPTTQTVADQMLHRVLKFSFSSTKPVQPKLFTPGPLLCTESVKLSMNYDYGSRDPRFIKIVRDIRDTLLTLSHVTPQEYQTVLMQGSGTFGVEATIGTAIPKTQHKLLVVANGAYGERIARMATILGINHSVLRYTDNQVVNVNDVVQKIKAEKDVTHLAMIHSETTSGLLNPITDVGRAIKDVNPKIDYIVDAMSSYGAYDINVKDSKIDYIVASSNKCLQGVPGFAFVVANKEKLSKTQGNARSLALDLYDQWKGLESNGQFRFTPPTHALKAFHTALNEYIQKGGVKAQNQRYTENQRYLSESMEKMGFRLYIDKKIQGNIITTFMEPVHPNFKFEEFYNFLAERNLIIYPGKLTQAASFRIGSIGELYLEDMKSVVNAVQDYLKSRNIPVPVPYQRILAFTVHEK
eukprot:TRINITY_DN3517_c0_g1_i3.p1 TRINITY_DN3517_c0_g1~~TRINITY_DN3517_c0_g1_i3.p1  ORF type:complete len:441 (+),score=112.42 TRINITY_DN3517_c0_g1_i3:107-1429(+)